jgi:chitin disaccharide deacetylase
MRIVLNADDFGYSTETVRATIECFDAGSVTSATIMPGMPATDEAVVFALGRPEISFGVHLMFVGDDEERPISHAADVPSLVGVDGRLRSTKPVRLQGLLGRLPVDQLEREIVAQVEAVRAQGVPVSHVDSHRHLHKYGSFRHALRRALPRLGIARVRNVQDVYLRRPFVSPTVWFGRRWRRDLMTGFVTTDHFYMPTTTGDLTWNKLLFRLPFGDTLEVGVHPGYEEEWRAHERRAVHEFAGAAREHGHALISWREV